MSEIEPAGHYRLVWFIHPFETDRVLMGALIRRPAGDCFVSTRAETRLREIDLKKRSVILMAVQDLHLNPSFDEPRGRCGPQVVFDDPVPMPPDWIIRAP